MALINQWEDVTYLSCDLTGNATTFNSTTSNGTCFDNGDEIISYYGFSKVCRKNFFF